MSHCPFTDTKRAIVDGLAVNSQPTPAGARKTPVVAGSTHYINHNNEKPKEIGHKTPVSFFAGKGTGNSRYRYKGLIKEAILSARSGGRAKQERAGAI